MQKLFLYTSTIECQSCNSIDYENPLLRNGGLWICKGCSAGIHHGIVLPKSTTLSRIRIGSALEMLPDETPSGTFLDDKVALVLLHRRGLPMVVSYDKTRPIEKMDLAVYSTLAKRYLCRPE